MGGGSSRMTKEEASKDLLRILLAKWLRGCLNDLRRDTGHYIKQLNLDTDMVNSVFFEILGDAIELVRCELMKENRG